MERSGIPRPASSLLLAGLGFAMAVLGFVLELHPRTRYLDAFMENAGWQVAFAGAAVMQVGLVGPWRFEVAPLGLGGVVRSSAGTLVLFAMLAALAVHFLGAHRAFDHGLVMLGGVALVGIQAGVLAAAYGVAAVSSRAP